VTDAQLRHAIDDGQYTACGIDLDTLTLAQMTTFPSAVTCPDCRIVNKLDPTEPEFSDGE